MINLKKIREKQNMTQEQLAERVGVIRQTISNIETGRSLPSVTNAQAIGEVLNFNWTLFFTD